MQEWDWKQSLQREPQTEKMQILTPKEGGILLCVCLKSCA